MEQAILF